MGSGRLDGPGGRRRTVSAVNPVEAFLPETYTAGVPYALFAELRTTRPVCRIEEPAVGAWPAGPGFWAVFRHADVKHVLRTPEVFSSHLGATQIRDPDTPADLEFVRAMMLNQDPPDHSRSRRIVAAAFTPRAVRELEEVIEERAAALVDSVAGRGETDFVELAADLPVWTLAHVMGIPEGDRRLLFDWASRVIGYQDDDYAGSSTAALEELSAMGRAALARRPAPAARRPDGRPMNPRSREALADMFAYAHALAERPRPGSVMARMREGGLSRDEFENMFFLFAVAGNETLRNGIPGGLLTLFDHPGSLRLLRDRPELTGPAVEEMLRFWPPVIDFRRTATRDVELGGQLIHRGEKVVVFHASANRDETVFTDPDRFDITRAPNDHLSFGFGPHVCLGAHLARVQMRAMLRAALDRLPGCAGRVSRCGSPPTSRTGSRPSPCAGEQIGEGRGRVADRPAEGRVEVPHQEEQEDDERGEHHREHQLPGRTADLQGEDQPDHQRRAQHQAEPDQMGHRGPRALLPGVPRVVHGGHLIHHRLIRLRLEIAVRRREGDVVAQGLQQLAAPVGELALVDHHLELRVHHMTHIRVHVVADAVAHRAGVDVRPLGHLVQCLCLRTDPVLRGGACLPDAGDRQAQHDRVDHADHHDHVVEDIGGLVRIVLVPEPAGVEDRPGDHDRAGPGHHQDHNQPFGHA
ncbi:hypothetical protein GCM10017744_015770 [Streptomyces antimycoticus]